MWRRQRRKWSGVDPGVVKARESAMNVEHEVEWLVRMNGGGVE